MDQSGLVHHVHVPVHSHIEQPQSDICHCLIPVVKLRVLMNVCNHVQLSLYFTTLYFKTTLDYKTTLFGLEGQFSVLNYLYFN